MTWIRFTARAEADLTRIADYTLHMWGETQKVRYVRSLQACCVRLEENPMLGRPCDEIRPGLRRMEEGKHVIFYRPEKNGIAVYRILHQSMVPKDRV
ncbi:MAG TPA: type II toxin-antitoxin system RelE/ParE family toxin [Acidobacteriaceae bacterium]|jgi:toxin ParE1/3/4|nr:type II toxin-antitoxin system RelE/ParE family toxin [Acidobacteriaceae bacterium]